ADGGALFPLLTMFTAMSEKTSGDGVTHRAFAHRRAGEWPTARIAGTITLDFEGRHRRRVRLITDERIEVLLDLPRAIAMADGDGLELENGLWLLVRAANEPVLEVAHDDPTQL